MADQIRLTYTNPETGSSVNTDLDVLSVKGWYDFDQIEIFPPIQNRYLDGSIDEQFSGLRRIIDIDFGVVSTFANRKAILYFLLDESRQINLTISSPTGFAGIAAAGSTSLANATYYYRVTAVNNVGETTGAAQVTVVITDGLNQVPRLSWNTVSGAIGYRLYRTAVSGDYAGEAHFLVQTTALTYDDVGSVALTTTYVLPTVQALTVALVNPSGYVNEWMNEISLARRFKVSLLDRTLRTTITP